MDSKELTLLWRVRAGARPGAHLCRAAGAGTVSVVLRGVLHLALCECVNGGATLRMLLVSRHDQRETHAPKTRATVPSTTTATKATTKAANMASMHNRSKIEAPHLHVSAHQLLPPPGNVLGGGATPPQQGLRLQCRLRLRKEGREVDVCMRPWNETQTRMTPLPPPEAVGVVVARRCALGGCRCVHAKGVVSPSASVLLLNASHTHTLHTKYYACPPQHRLAVQWQTRRGIWGG